jgi:hypothetical protein
MTTQESLEPAPYILALTHGGKDNGLLLLIHVDKHRHIVVSSLSCRFVKAKHGELAEVELLDADRDIMKDEQPKFSNDSTFVLQ